MRSDDVASPATGAIPLRPGSTAPSRTSGASHRRVATRIYELAVTVPLLGWLAYVGAGHLGSFVDPMLLMWLGTIAVVDLLPVPTSLDLRFSLSFPLQLAVALIYAPPVAGAIAFLGTSDTRELRRELPLPKALFIRAQIALSVVAESALFHAVASLHSPWFVLGPVVLAATVVGYSINSALVAWYFHLESGEPVLGVVRQMHVGIFGEFVASYMGLALFGVLVATSFMKVGIWSIAVFIAPLAFARQMFLRTNSLQEATEALEVRQRENEHQALHDALTGLPNRTLFLQRLEEALAEARETDRQVAVMIMDLDDFKEVNDTLGHQFGDLLLREVATRLSSGLREQDLMARLGGDEFGVVLPDLAGEQTAVHVAERLLECMREPLALEELALDISTSIGIAVYPAHSEDVETLLRRADVAMYAAKEARSGYELYQGTQDHYSPERLALLSQLRPAIDNGEFILHYQPKVDVTGSGVIGVEALIRWQHSERGLVGPNEFIPYVERSVLLRPVTEYVLNEALRQWQEWDKRGQRLQMAVNLSARNLLDAQLPDKVDELLQAWGVPAEYLTVELTESTLVADSARSMAVLHGLAEVGIALSIDDFGTGYSSLSYLRRLPLDEIKVDRSFVTNMRTDQGNATIVRATVDLGRNLGLRVVAEGVEDQETWAALGMLGCDVAQGFFISRPLPPEDLSTWVRSHPAGLTERDGVVSRPPETRHLKAL